MMNTAKPIFVFAFVLVLAAIGHAQSTMSGKVVEVLDGKTVVIEVASGKLTAGIKYIDVPEPEQPLHQTVREHLEKLVLGKDVVFRASGFDPGKTFGQLYVKSADVALQMLRDGAAWQVPVDKSGQNEADSSAYQYHQNLARQEQRGVWGVKDLKPAWQFRADKLERARQAEIASEYVGQSAKSGNSSDFSNVVLDKPVRRSSNPWSDVNPYLKNPGPLVHGYNAASKSGYVGTSLMGLKDIENIPSGKTMAVDITYLYKQQEKNRTGKFVVTLFSVADQFHFLKANTIKVMVDEKSVFAGKPTRTTTNQEGKLVEKLTYEVSKAAVEKIVYGGDVTIQIGSYNFYPTQGLQLLLYNMLQVSS